MAKRLEDHLDPGEQILARVMGAYEDNGYTRNGEFAATDKRIVFFGKRWTVGFDLESYPYSKITSFNHSKSLLGNAITIVAANNEIKVKWIKGDVAGFLEAVRSRLGAGPVAVAAPVAAADPKDRLAKLNEMKAAGLVTDEEYETQKARILSEI